MESPQAYIPTDRRLALAQGSELPERSDGAALFADISGFTSLTEALVRALGPQRGAEELAGRLNVVYDALIAETDRYGGSVIGFSGDAITCWFAEGGDGDTAPAQRAVACALAIQRTMGQFAAISIPDVGTVGLAIKVAVTAGPARRFVVGDPQIQLVDALAGETIARLGTAERLAERGDVLLDEACIAALGEGVSVQEWRVDDESGQRFAVAAGLSQEVAPLPWPALDEDRLKDEQLRPWLLAPVSARLTSGMGAFLTELRPAVALFVRFGGIDYDGDPDAEARLNDYLAWAIRIIDRYGGYLLQLTIGDKGSYFYAAFGAPVAHEDNASRAMRAALELVAAPPELAYIGAVQIGVSQGGMRTGAYGGSTRRTYGVLGDDVNTAARLMQSAPAGQIYVSAAARSGTGDSYIWWELPPLRVKGKALPVTVYRLLDVQERRTIRLQEPKYALPMVGREVERSELEAKLELARRGQGQILGVTAEAGMGKSRLMAELIRMARERQVVAYGGECQSHGTATPYLVWRSIWRSFFGVEPGADLAAQVAQLAQALGAIDPALLPRLPLLGAVLNLQIPDNELTAGLEPRLRKSALEALLADCLRARAGGMPLLLVLEDCHWLDPLSHDLLEVLARAAADLPVLIALAYRPPQVPRLMAPRVTELTHFDELRLGSLSDDEIARLAQVKLGQLYGPGAALAPELAARIGARAEGNPFYIEELLSYLHARGVDPQQPEALAQVELPASLHSLILSRIDQLSEDQKTLLKVASVIGRLFRAAMLWGVFGQFGNQERVRAELDILSDMELTPLDTPDPELAYLFKHILTQQVAYETLPFAARALIHGQIGQYIEQTYAAELDRYLDLLAYHYDLSADVAKRREYLLKAGASAQAAYANAAALDYYRRVVPLLEGHERCRALLLLGQVLETTGQWAEAEEQCREALALAEALGDEPAQAQCRIAIGELRRRQGEFASAGELFAQANALAARLDDRPTLAKALICAGTLAVQQGEFAVAQERYGASLALRRALGDLPAVSNLLNNMSIVASYQGDLPAARALQEESLAIRRGLGNPWMIANSLNNLGMFATDQGEYALAGACLEEAVGLQRQVGDPSALATTLHTLANLRRSQGLHAQALGLYQESLQINRRLGDSWMLVQLLEDVGWLMASLGEHERSLRFAGAAAAARAQLGTPLPPADQARLDAALAAAREALGAAAEAVWAEGAAIPLDRMINDVRRLELS
jgi:predicted ATPase/class 3 adenylate cyclase